MTSFSRPLLVAVLCLLPSLAAAQVKPVKVYVFCAQAPFVDEASKGRADSLADLRKQLATKDKEILLVTNPDESDLALEVLGRGQSPTGGSSMSRDFLTGQPKSSPDYLATLWVKMTLADYSTELTGQSSNMVIPKWRECAKDVAGKVAKWIRENDSRIPRK